MFNAGVSVLARIETKEKEGEKSSLSWGPFSFPVSSSFESRIGATSFVTCALKSVD